MSIRAWPLCILGKWQLIVHIQKLHDWHLRDKCKTLRDISNLVCRKEAVTFSTTEIYSRTLVSVNSSRLIKPSYTNIFLDSPIFLNSGTLIFVAEGHIFVLYL